MESALPAGLYRNVLLHVGEVHRILQNGPPDYIGMSYCMRAEVRRILRSAGFYSNVLLQECPIAGLLHVCEVLFGWSAWMGEYQYACA